eukprot:Ihof_evm5s222 gene=Ihof_evmTU5s222
MKFSQSLSLLLLAAASIAGLVNAQEDIVIDKVNGEPIEESQDSTADAEEVVTFEEGVYAGDSLRKNPDLEHHLVFTKTGNSTEFIAGELQYILTGFRNTGKSDLMIESIEASIRYPQQWDFRLINFTTIGYGKKIAPGEVLSLDYTFKPHESFENREYGLTVLVNYADMKSGVHFRHAIFNGTANFYESQTYAELHNAALLIFAVLTVIVFTLGVRNAMTPKNIK